jgi:serine/threonine protein phosphatase PrpC
MSDTALLLNGRTDVLFANASDTGCVRAVNEDYYLFIEPPDDAEFQQRGRLVVVADGMGGHKGGRIASRLAADTIRDVFLTAADTDPLAVLQEGFHRAHQAIRQIAVNDPELDGMGTTCTAIILRGLSLALGHIGDSRLYLIRGGSTTQLSRDHTVVNGMVESGLITPEEAEHHERKHVLSAAMGVSPDLKADFVQDPATLTPGDTLLLCSDGLHGLISDEEIAAATIDQPLSEACAELLAWAKVRGGPDNITLQMIRIEAAPTKG